jgi:hypothetical protein
MPLARWTGCLHLSEGSKESWDVLETGEVNASNDDIDLLVAFEAEGKTRLLLIEAKGVTGWRNKQLRKKARRLGGIFGFGETSERWPWIDPTFMLASPREPVQIDVSEWPLWMKAEDRPQHWLELTSPPTSRRSCGATRAARETQMAASGKWSRRCSKNFQSAWQNGCLTILVGCPELRGALVRCGDERVGDVRVPRIRYDDET